jgi:hypothetical protein
MGLRVMPGGGNLGEKATNGNTGQTGERISARFMRF